jgi:hypothetical protein
MPSTPLIIAPLRRSWRVHRRLPETCWEVVNLTDMKILSDQKIFCRSEKKIPKNSLSYAQVIDQCLILFLNYIIFIVFTPFIHFRFNQTHLWRRSRHDWLFVYILANGMTSFIQPLTYSTMSSKQQNSRHTIKDITYTILNNTENWITLTSIKTRGEIRCPIANTWVNHSNVNLTDMKILSDQKIFCRSEKKIPKNSLSYA